MSLYCLLVLWLAGIISMYYKLYICSLAHVQRRHVNDVHKILAEYAYFVQTIGKC